jgi:hypothetical protein
MNPQAFTQELPSKEEALLLIKKCSKCGEVKTTNNFNKDCHKKSGFRTCCKQCQAFSKAVYSKTKTRVIKNYSKQNSEKAKRSKLRVHFNLTLEQYYEQLESQNSLCAICGHPEEVIKRRLCVDHDHITGQVRGLLCGKCNCAIGLLGDDPTLIKAALTYLKKWKIT